MEPSSSSSSSFSSSPSPSPAAAARRQRPPEARRVRKQKLEEVLEQVQRAIKMLRDTDADLGTPLSEVEAPPGSGVHDVGDDAATSSVASDSDYETTQMCDLLKSKVESLEFLQNLDAIQKSSVYKNGAGTVGTDTSWDIIKAVDYWEDDIFDDEYVLVNQEDVVDGITSFMATYLLSFKQTKELSPDQLQKALKKTFSVQKSKSKIRKAWDGTKVVYNVASWGATAVGVYNNQAILAIAATARTSFRVISKFL